MGRGWLPPKHRGRIAEIAHTDKSDNGTDQGQPLEPLRYLGVTGEAEITRKANQPHGSTAPKTDGQPTQRKYLAMALRVLLSDRAVAEGPACAASQIRQASTIQPE